jgi:hypothetical protein
VLELHEATSKELPITRTDAGPCALLTKSHPLIPTKSKAPAKMSLVMGFKDTFSPDTFWTSRHEDVVIEFGSEPGASNVQLQWA